MNFKNKKTKLITLFLVACQSILFTLLAAFFIGNNYNKTILRYPNVEKDTIYLKDISDSQKDTVMNFFAQKIEENHLVLIKVEQTSSRDGNSEDIKMGILGDVDKHPLPLSFSGQNVFSNATIKKLLYSDKSKTIGNELGFESISATPNFAGGQHLIVFKLEDLIKQSGNINGAYQIIGLNNKQKHAFLTDLAKITKESEKNLQKPLSGGQSQESLIPTILVGGIVLSALGLLILFLLNLLQSLRLLGDLVLLGWSKVSFLMKLYIPYLVAAFAMSIITVPLGVIISGRYWSFWSLFFVVNLLSTATVALLILLASSLLMTMSFLDILKHKFPRKALLLFSVLGYILLSASIISGSYYLDGPMQTLSETYQLSKNWQKVSHLTILKNAEFKSSSQDTQDAVKTRSKDFYLWYKGIHKERGVYLIGTTIYTSKALDASCDAKAAPPLKQPFLELTVSPNYLKELGITVPANILNAAERGKRLYLLPSSFSPTTRDKVKTWLQKRDTQTISPTDTPTVFNQKRQFIFNSYHSQTDFFTWATKTDEPLRMKRVIILVATPANMNYVESDNISAAGFNGLAKLDTNKMSSASKKRIFASRQISAYNPTFTTIGSFIKGVQKDLSYTLYLFGAVGAVLLVLSLTLVYAIIRIYQVSQQELFNVKKFLGYSIFNIYSKPLAFLAIAFVLELLTTIFIRSRAGTLVIIIKFILQTIFVLLYLRQSSINQLLNSLKEE